MLTFKLSVFSKPMRFGIPEDSLIGFVSTGFHWLPFQTAKKRASELHVNCSLELHLTNIDMYSYLL